MIWQDMSFDDKQTLINILTIFVCILTIMKLRKNIRRYVK